MQKDLKELTTNLQKLSKSKSSSDVVIAEFLIKIIQQDLDFPNIDLLAKKLNVSKSSISRFISKTNVDNYQVLRYVINNFNQQEHNVEVNSRTKESINKASKLLLNAQKIYFWGLGDSKIICRDLNIKFLRGGLTSVFVSDVYEAVSISKLSKTKDVIIVVSISGSTEYFYDHISDRKAKKILITTNMNKDNILIKNSDVIINIPGQHLFTERRLMTQQERIDAYKVLDLLINTMLKDKKFRKNIKKIGR